MTLNNNNKKYIYLLTWDYMYNNEILEYYDDDDERSIEFWEKKCKLCNNKCKNWLLLKKKENRVQSIMLYDDDDAWWSVFMRKTKWIKRNKTKKKWKMK